MLADLLELGYRDADAERIRVAINAAGRASDYWPTVHRISLFIPKAPRSVQLPPVRESEAARRVRELADTEQIRELRAPRDPAVQRRTLREMLRAAFGHVAPSVKGEGR